MALKADAAVQQRRIGAPTKVQIPEIGGGQLLQQVFLEDLLEWAKADAGQEGARGATKLRELGK
jgi:hypothetical protein